MHPPGADVVLVRYGEVGLKSDQVRRTMEDALVENLRALLDDRDVAGEVRRGRTRIFVDTGDLDAATEAATDAFGVVSASPARTVEPTVDAISGALAAAAQAHYAGGTFAVRARRAGEPDDHPFDSQDLGEAGGSAVWRALEAVGHDPAVDLDDPDFELFVECRPERAYIYLEVCEGPGGLPLGSQRPVVALVSGGIDSPVAAWRAMRRGSPVVPVYVDLGAYGGADHRARAESTVDALSRYAPDRDTSLRVVPAGDLVAEVVRATGETRMLHLRRCMVAIGEAVAREADAVGIVTGEAVGQKSSQTAANLAVTDAAVDLPVLRPNLTADKTEITERARAIGTFAESTIPAGCERVAPSFPETNADLDAVREAEPDGLLERARDLVGARPRTDGSGD